MRRRFADIAAQTAAGFFARLFGPQRRHGFLEGLRADRGREELRVMACEGRWAAAASGRTAKFGMMLS